ncbi:MAG: glutamine-hydrolyzing GMP synthase [Oligoflexia bacterium]|nr:glutamine-hydrolyzing GMP synthase [Oligoflexia bacterium]
MQAQILILDFGSQFTQLIARRIRELGVFTEIRPCTDPPPKHATFKALILSGGPASVTDADAPKFDPAWLALGVPVLGICYGMQLIAHLSGGILEKGSSREYGFSTIEVADNSSLLSGFELNEHTTVWMSHGDHVGKPPPGYKLLARTLAGVPAAIGNPDKKTYCLQFHPEVVHSPRGTEMLSNFIFNICSLSRDWSSAGFIEQTIATIRRQLPEGSRAICALSGGVDSTVAAALVHRAIGERLHCVFVDNGVLRKEEAPAVMARLGRGGLNLNIKAVDASDTFLAALKGVSNPEEKRKIIGRTFIEIFDHESKSIPGVTHLVQGTLYPDVIESVSVRGPSATIKSHHNVGGLPEKMKLKLIEPLRELFKDEVRKIGAELGVSEDILKRQPFPGPGLAVRIIGDITPAKLDLLREADHILVEEIKAQGLYHTLWQSFAVLLPVQSVGVMGDGRTYEQTVAIRAVVSEDGMTADWAYLPHDLLRRVSSRIVNEVRGINRVVLDISSKPPATIEWE